MVDLEPVVAGERYTQLMVGSEWFVPEDGVTYRAREQPAGTVVVETLRQDAAPSEQSRPNFSLASVRGVPAR